MKLSYHKIILQFTLKDFFRLEESQKAKLLYEQWIQRKLFLSWYILHLPKNVVTIISRLVRCPSWLCFGSVQYHHHLPTLPQPAQHLPKLIYLAAFYHFLQIFLAQMYGHSWLETECGPNEHEFFKVMLQTFSKWVRSGKEKLISRSAPLLKLVQQTNEQMTDRKAVYISFHEKSRLCFL